MPPRRTVKQKTPRSNPTVSELPSLGSRTCSGIPIELYSYHDHPNNRSLVAVYHNDYRQVWIAEYDTDLYTHGRAKGTMANDITCFYGPHQHWGPTRKNWPEVIFQYKPDTERPSNRGTPGWLYTVEGWLVLDRRSAPVLAFNMPLTISSVCEDWLLEAIVRDCYHDNVGVQDIQARMPGMLDANGSEPIRTGTISMRMTRFRKIAGCISWTPKVGSESIENYLASILPEECKQANSTRGFRNLWPYERAEIDLQNTGQFPNKARPDNKDFTQRRQYEKIVKAWNKYMQLKKAHEEEYDTTVPVRQTLHDYLEAVGLSDYDEFDEASATKLALQPRRSLRSHPQTPQPQSCFRGTGSRPMARTTDLARFDSFSHEAPISQPGRSVIASAPHYNQTVHTPTVRTPQPHHSPSPSLTQATTPSISIYTPPSNHIPYSTMAWVPQNIYNDDAPGPGVAKPSADLSETLLDFDCFGSNQTFPRDNTNPGAEAPEQSTTNQPHDVPATSDIDFNWLESGFFSAEDFTGGD
ncbi:MAG: hypothetical protein Q9191_003403 [Dirinaria sp. TL-2023a]